MARVSFPNLNYLIEFRFCVDCARGHLKLFKWTTENDWPFRFEAFGLPMDNFSEFGMTDTTSVAPNSLAAGQSRIAVVLIAPGLTRKTWPFTGYPSGGEVGQVFTFLMEIYIKERG